MPATGFRLGLSCVLVRNTGSYGTPVWNVVDNCKDVELSLDKDEADVTRRASGGWKEIIGALKSASIDFDMVFMDSDADFTAIQSAFMNNTAIEFAVMDGPVATAGSQGLRATMEVMKFSRSEKLTDSVMYSVSIKPTAAANPPAWMIVA